MPIGQTIDDRLAATGGATSGFDHLRLVLAVSVLLWHSYVTMHGQSAGTLYQGSGYGAW